MVQAFFNDFFMSVRFIQVSSYRTPDVPALVHDIAALPNPCVIFRKPMNRHGLARNTIGRRKARYSWETVDISVMSRSEAAIIGMMFEAYAISVTFGFSECFLKSS